MTLVELAPLFSLLGGAAGAGVTNVFLARWLEAKDLRAKERQTRWLPFLEAAEDIRARLADLQEKYRKIPEDKVWRRSEAGIENPVMRDNKRLPTWARDFHELYTFREPLELTLILNQEDASVDPVEVLDKARKNDALASRVRIRMGHQLNYAASTLYIVARYLSYAYRIRRDLNAGRLDLRKIKIAAKAIASRLKEVREELHGTSKKHPGAGMLLEQQDCIGEIMWSAENDLIGYSEFQSRLLTSPGWEQFIGLFRFFVAVDLKLNTEVELTKLALGRLCDELKRVTREQ